VAGNGPESPVPVIVRAARECPIICHVNVVLGRDPPMQVTGAEHKFKPVRAALQLTPDQLHAEEAVHAVALIDVRMSSRAARIVVLTSQGHAAAHAATNVMATKNIWYSLGCARVHMKRATNATCNVRKTDERYSFCYCRLRGYDKRFTVHQYDNGCLSHKFQKTQTLNIQNAPFHRGVHC
jgi:ribulose bisphosphate carboxylase small subunit